MTRRKAGFLHLHWEMLQLQGYKITKNDLTVLQCYLTVDKSQIEGRDSASRQKMN